MQWPEANLAHSVWQAKNVTLCETNKASLRAGCKYTNGIATYNPAKLQCM